MSISSLHGLPCRPVGSARQTVKRGLRRAVGYSGRQSLRSFALGYYLVAPTGRQTEPPASAMQTLRRIWPNKPAAANPAIASWSQSRRRWRGVADPGRSVPLIRTSLFLSLLLVSALFTGCVLPLPLPHAAKRSPSLDGHVRDAKTGEPISGAAVELITHQAQARDY